MIKQVSLSIGLVFGVFWGQGTVAADMGGVQTPDVALIDSVMAAIGKDMQVAHRTGRPHVHRRVVRRPVVRPRVVAPAAAGAAAAAASTPTTADDYQVAKRKCARNYPRYNWNTDKVGPPGNRYICPFVKPFL